MINVFILSDFAYANRNSNNNSSSSSSSASSLHPHLNSKKTPSSEETRDIKLI